MANVVLMPQKGISEESAVLTEFKIKVGGLVKKGDIIFSLETGKSAFDVESEFDGEVLALLVSEGDEVLIKAPVMVIGAKGEAFDLPKTDAKADTQPAFVEKPVETVAKPVEKAVESFENKEDNLWKISKRAKNLAESSGVDYTYATASGPEGRIIERDILGLIENPVQAKDKPIKASSEPFAEFVELPATAMRKTIAANMLKSMQTQAQLTLNSSFDATAILAYRKQLKEIKDLEKITLNDFVLYAVSRVLLNHKFANAHFLGDKFRLFNTVNLACAVDIEGGLVVPVIRNAERKSLLEISNEMKTLAQKCQSGNYTADMFSNATFTITNLGSLSVESFTPVINPPQTCILGVNTITTRVKEENGEIAAYPSMALSLTFDHCALDGAPAARLLKDICMSLEQFTAFLAR